MRIAVYANVPGAGDYCLAVLLRLAEENKDVHVLLLTPSMPGIPLSRQVSWQQVPYFRNVLPQRGWLETRLPLILKKWKATVLVGLDGSCSLRARLPQLVAIGGLPWVHHPQYFTALDRQLRPFFLRRTIKKAKLVFTSTAHVRAVLAEMFPAGAPKLKRLPVEVPQQQPITSQEAEQVKDGFANGREYFLFQGGFAPSQNLLNVLKAFSGFKSWQRSNMKLLIAGDPAACPDTRDKIGRYKYRDDVTVLGVRNPAELARLAASAYALVYPPVFDLSAQLLVESLGAGTAVITSDTADAIELAGDAALYADPLDPAGIAEKMIAVYKDEELRARLIAAGRQRAVSSQANEAATQLWQMLLEVTAQP